jgi:hypothetical protein
MGKSRQKIVEKNGKSDEVRKWPIIRNMKLNLN